MSDRAGVADQVVRMMGQVLDVPQLPVRVRFWDGSVAGPADAPCVIVNSSRALQRIAGSPNQIGLGQAYVAGDLDLDGDVFEALRLLNNGEAKDRSPRRRTGGLRAPLMRMAAQLGTTFFNAPAPEAPAEEVGTLTGEPHCIQRDRAAIGHHYDVGNDFYRLVLGPSMTYSCAVWGDPRVGLDAAQDAKHDLICRKLGLHEESAPADGRVRRLLDVGCGWGSMVLHAAQRYGVRAVGITLSREQATFARRRVAEAGLSDRVEIRIQDYREIDDGPYDAISSIGMAEHVGKAQMVSYARHLYRLLAPRGRLLNHAIAAARPEAGTPRETFISRYVFPDGELLTIGEMISALTEGGFEIRDVESLREHYALTLRAWVANLQSHWDRAVKLTSQGRARVWQLYMAGSALAFEAGRIGVNQVLCVKADGDGAAGLPLRRRV